MDQLSIAGGGAAEAGREMAEPEMVIKKQRMVIEIFTNYRCVDRLDAPLARHDTAQPTILSELETNQEGYYEDIFSICCQCHPLGTHLV